jgi:hypothetical protein
MLTLVRVLFCPSSLLPFRVDREGNRPLRIPELWPDLSLWFEVMVLDALPTPHLPPPADRILVHSSLHDEFVARLATELESLKVLFPAP